VSAPAIVNTRDESGRIVNLVDDGTRFVRRVDDRQGGHCTSTRRPANDPTRRRTSELDRGTDGGRTGGRAGDGYSAGSNRMIVPSGRPLP
jgi:hypothetical protein